MTDSPTPAFRTPQATPTPQATSTPPTTPTTPTTSTSPAGPPPTVLIGQAARATRAVFDHLLESTAIPFEEWAVVNLVSSNQWGRDELIARMVAGLRLPDAEVTASVADAIADGLVADTAPLEVTPAGRAVHAATFDALLASTSRIYGGLDPADLATTLRVLATVTERAEAELAN